MSIDRVQKFLAEVDSVELLESYLRFAMITVLDSFEELAVKVVDREKEYLSLYLPSVLMDQKKHFPVILIEGWFFPKKGEKNSYFSGYEPWKTFHFDGITPTVDVAIRYIKELLEEQKNAWETQFMKELGDGYTSGFNGSDGFVGLGYELRACGCFPEKLAVSLIHMYYGK